MWNMLHSEIDRRSEIKNAWVGKHCVVNEFLDLKHDLRVESRRMIQNTFASARQLSSLHVWTRKVHNEREEAKKGVKSEVMDIQR